MGTFNGHLIPGTEFILLAVFLNLIHKAEQFVEAQDGETGNYSSVRVTDVEHAEKEEDGQVRQKEETNTRKTARIKLWFSLYGIVSISLGILYEGGGGIVMNKEGGFFSELGHMTMYVSFLPAVISYGLESGLLWGSRENQVVNAPLLSQSGFTIAFFIQYLLLDAHSMMKKPGADFLFHKLWAYSALYLFLVYLLSVLSQLAGLKRLARVAQLACPAFLLIQGSWVVMTGWILFGGEFRVMRNGDMGMEKIESLFGLTILFCCVFQYIWIEVIPSSFASRYHHRVQ